MNKIERAKEIAKAAGFDVAADLDAGTIRLKEEVRAMCAEGKCHAYGHNWTCPPACGDLDHCRTVIGQYAAGIIVQTVGHLEDNMDYETMMDTSRRHKECFNKMAEAIKAEFPDALCLGAGGCTVCKKCAFPEPCRFPQKAYSSMEGYGMLVSEVCTSNDLPYYYGENTIAFVGCCLLVKREEQPV